MVSFFTEGAEHVSGTVFSTWHSPMCMRSVLMSHRKAPLLLGLWKLSFPLYCCPGATWKRSDSLHERANPLQLFCIYSDLCGLCIAWKLCFNKFSKSWHTHIVNEHGVNHSRLPHGLSMSWSSPQSAASQDRELRIRLDTKVCECRHGAKICNCNLPELLQSWICSYCTVSPVCVVYGREARAVISNEYVFR